MEAVVRRLEPDLVLLNESGGRWRLRRFARAVGMLAAADPWSPFRRRVKNAVLVRSPWTIVEHRLLRFAGSARFYPRGALVAQVVRPGHRVVVVSVHLGLRPRERLRHARELADALRGLDGPVLVGGDLNETPGRGAAAFLAERLSDAWPADTDEGGDTFPARAATARIDYLFASEGVGVGRAVVPSAPEVRTASDHRPVLVEVEIADRG